MVDRSVIGAEGAPFEMLVETGKIREFARATKSEHAAYLESDAPVSPPTFLTTANFWQRGDSSPMGALKLDLRRLLHGEQEYVFHGPPPAAGTKLTALNRVEDVYEREGKRGGVMTFAKLLTEFRDEAGKLVAEARLTAIETGRPPAEG